MNLCVGQACYHQKCAVCFINLLMRAACFLTWFLFIESNLVLVHCMTLNVLHVSGLVSEATGSALCFWNVLMAHTVAEKHRSFVLDLDLFKYA